MEDVTPNLQDYNIREELESLKDNLSKLNTDEIAALRYYAK